MPRLEVPGSPGLGRAAEHKGMSSSKTLSGSPAECTEAAERSPLVFGQQSQKADVPLRSFLSLAPGPWQDWNNSWHPWSSWAAKLLLLTHNEQPLSLKPPSFRNPLDFGRLSSTPPAQMWYSPILAESGLCPSCPMNKKIGVKSMALLELSLQKEGHLLLHLQFNF